MYTINYGTRSWIIECKSRKLQMQKKEGKNDRTSAVTARNDNSKGI